MKKILYGEEFDLIDMTKDGYNDLVFDVISSIKFMYLATKNGELILGGDIITKNNDGKYEVSYDNWYSNSKSPEETFLTALDYLKIYMQGNNNADWKVSVVSSNLLELLKSINLI